MTLIIKNKDDDVYGKDDFNLDNIECSFIQD